MEGDGHSFHLFRRRRGNSISDGPKQEKSSYLWQISKRVKFSLFYAKEEGRKAKIQLGFFEREEGEEKHFC